MGGAASHTWTSADGVVSRGRANVSVQQTEFWIHDWNGKTFVFPLLWHWPLITFGKIQSDLNGVPELQGAVLGAGAGLVLALGTYFYVERPLRTRRHCSARQRLSVACGLIMVAGIGSFIASQPRIADPTSLFNTPSFSANTFDAGFDEEVNMATSQRLYDLRFPDHPAADLGSSWRSGGIVHSHGSRTPKVVVLGSSHALMYSKLIDDICMDLRVSVAFLGVNGTPTFSIRTVNHSFPTQEEAKEFDDARRNTFAIGVPRLYSSLTIGRARKYRLSTLMLS